MKNQVKASLQNILKNRFLSILLGVFLLECFVLLIYLVISIQPSELQVVVHYTSFGTTNFYRDKWQYLITFDAFIVFMATIHTLLVAKLLTLKGKDFAEAFAWLGIVMVIIAAALFYQVLKIASLS